MKKAMIRITAFLLILILLCSATACKDEEQPAATPTTDEVVLPPQEPSVQEETVMFSYSEGVFTVTYADGSTFTSSTTEPLWVSADYTPASIGVLSSNLNVFRKTECDDFFKDFFAFPVSLFSIELELIYNHVSTSPEKYYEFYGDYDVYSSESAPTKDPMVVIQFRVDDAFQGAIVINNSGELVWEDARGNYYQTKGGNFKTDDVKKAITVLDDSRIQVGF